MKTLWISLAFSLIVPFATQAQTEKGRWTVGAQVGNISYQNQNGGRTITVSISPSAGYFITNGLVIGTSLPLSVGSQKSTDNNSYLSYNYKTSAIGLSPFVRYYLGQQKLKPYLSLAYSYSRLTIKTTQHDMRGMSSSDGTGKNTALVPTIGLAYFVSQNLALTAGLNYTIAHQDQETTTLVDGFPPSPNSNSSDTKTLSLSIGFQLFIGK